MLISISLYVNTVVGHLKNISFINTCWVSSSVIFERENHTFHVYFVIVMRLMHIQSVLRVMGVFLSNFFKILNSKVEKGKTKWRWNANLSGKTVWKFPQSDEVCNPPGILFHTSPHFPLLKCLSIFVFQRHIPHFYAMNSQHKYLHSFHSVSS